MCVISIHELDTTNLNKDCGSVLGEIIGQSFIRIIVFMTSQEHDSSYLGYAELSIIMMNLKP